MQQLFVGMLLMRFSLRFAEEQGQAEVVCGTLEEQIGQTPGDKL